MIEKKFPKVVWPVVKDSSIRYYFDENDELIEEYELNNRFNKINSFKVIRGNGTCVKISEMDNISLAFKSKEFIKL